MTNTAQAEVIEAISPFQQLFIKQRKASRSNAYPSIETRIKNLKKLEDLLVEHQFAIADAICADFGNRSQQETRLLEIFGLVGSISDTRKKLKKWAKPQKRHVSLAFFGAKNTVIPQPKGVIGVVTPWNYPLFLSVGPCISALAAGNRCIVKMAANSQTLCKLMNKLVSESIDDEYLAFVPGVSAGEFTHQPWDHLVFTGSPATAKIVMETAAKTLTPVTLELGGKSPTIIADDYDITLAAERILLGKFLNAGQTCVAPDYVFVPRNKVEEFTTLAKSIVSKRYPTAESKDFTSIIDDKAYNRLIATLKDATDNGATAINLVEASEANAQTRKIPPHIVLEANEDSLIMKDEIFGPFLPIKPYDNIDEVIEYINNHERPLALYLYSNSKAVQEKVTYRTISGGMCINDNMFHAVQHDMPFGGIGNSGMGHYHGKEGFIEFSKLRPIFKQSRFNAIPLLAPPYGKTFDKIVGLMLKLKL